MAKTLIPWREICLWDSDGLTLTHEKNPIEHAEKLREYRNANSIADWFLADPAEFPDDHEGRICDAGPSRAEIDFAGLDGFLVPDEMVAIADGLTATARCVGEKCDSEIGWADRGKPDLWHMHFKITLRGNGSRATFDFYGSQRDFDAFKRTLDDGEIKSAVRCILDDGASGDMDFEDFCSEFGYDTDSRKAERTHKACQRTRAKLARVFTGDLCDLLNSLSVAGGPARL